MMIDAVEALSFKQGANALAADVRFTQAGPWMEWVTSSRRAVVQDHHLCSTIDQPIGHVRADETRTTGDEYFHAALL
jgi:hypothetical protein